MNNLSFDPWMSRVRMARTSAAALGFALVSLLGYEAGLPFDDAILRGLVAAIICFFVGWASALWICGELFGAEISRRKQALREHERQRQEQLQQIYEQRVASLGGEPGQSLSDLTTSPIGGAPPLRDAA